MNDNNPLLLDYHDACIYKSDLALLENNTAWLNDACINFYMTRMTHNSRNKKQKQQNQNQNQQKRKRDSSQKEGEEEPSSASSVIMKFIDPSAVSFFMHQLSLEDEDDKDEIINLCRNWADGASSYSTSSPPRMMLLPINDNHGGSKQAFQTPGSGNHWSLLVFYIIPNGLRPSDNKDGEDNYCYCNLHFDSSSGCNENTAVRVAKKLGRMFSLFITKDMNKDSNDIDINNKITECETSQQMNGYDCGVCTLCAVQAIQDADIHEYDTRCRDGGRKDIIVRYWLEEAISNFANKYKNTNDMSRSMRKDIVLDIQSLIDADKNNNGS